MSSVSGNNQGSGILEQGRNQARDGFGSRVYTSVGQVAHNTVTLIEAFTARECTLEHLELSGDKESLCPLIVGLKSDGNDDDPIYIPAQDGGSGVYPTATLITLHKSSIFEVLLNDGGNNYYKIGLLRPLTFGNGFKLNIFQNSGAEGDYCISYVTSMKNAHDY